MRLRIIGTSVALAAALIATAGAAAAETTIVYANYLSTKHPTNKVLEAFFANVEKETDGSVQFDFHPAASLLSGKAIPSGVRDGIADAGYFVGAYVPSEMPVDSYLGSFGLFSEDPLVMSGVNNELVLLHCPQCEEEYSKFNVYFMATYALTPYLLQCANEVRTPEDLEGLKVRALSVWADLIRTLGAVPFNVSSNELYEAMERGTLDCITGVLEWQRSRSLGEVAKYVITDPGLGSFLGGSAFNLRKDKWAQLNEKEKQAIVKNLPMIVSHATFNYIDLDKEVKKEYEQKGTKFYAAAPELADAIEDFKESYSKNVIDEGHKMGVENPEKIAETVFQLKEKWTALIGDKEWTRDTYEQLLWDEIYSKVKFQ